LYRGLSIESAKLGINTLLGLTNLKKTLNGWDKERNTEECYIHYVCMSDQDIIGSELFTL